MVMHEKQYTQENNKKHTNTTLTENLNAMPPGWGCSYVDLDLDGDSDITYYGNFNEGNDFAVINDHFEIVKFLYSKGLTCPEYAIDDAAEMDILKWLDI